ncbi:MAG: hypothetical protein JST73_10795, partial [Actinobacteria bacterium]|nr:hypothetical protein [Actinomycetota bacterium]
PMPVSIAQWGVPGLQVNAPPVTAALPTGCSSKFVLLDNHDVPVHVSGTVGDALAGDNLTVTPCGPSAANGVEMGPGRHNLLTAAGANSGLDFDQLAFRSAAGGSADHSTGLLVDRSATAGPKIRIDGQSRTSYDLTVTGADARFWLVLGQSQSAGWHATVDGKALGASRLVNGYANGWSIDPAGRRVLHVELTWTPQRVIWIAIGLSAMAMAACLVLALRPGFRHKMVPLADEHRPTGPGRASDSVPLPFEWRSALQYRGAPPKAKVVVGVTVAAALVSGVLAGWWTAPILGVAAFVCLRFRKARRILTFGSPACLLAAGAYVAAFVTFRDTYLRFGWTSWFDRVAPLGWLAVLGLALDVVVERCWLRRWWSSAEEPDE